MKVNVFALIALLLFVGCKKADDDEEAASKPLLTLEGAGSGTGDLSTNDADTVDAESIMVKVFSLHASVNEDCSDPVEIFTKSDADAEYFDFLSGPTLGEGEVAIGEYPCVMIEMSDTIKFTPSASTEACEVDEEYEMDVCRDGSTADSPDGDTSDCSDEEDKVTLFLSTLSESEGSGNGESAECEEDYDTNCNTFKAPTDDYPNRGINLGAALEIEKATVSTFIVDGTDKVQDEQARDGGEDAPFDQCGMNPPDFSFEN
jgi:hypothetical protein